jgi:hypothetical protein
MLSKTMLSKAMMWAVLLITCREARLAAPPRIGVYVPQCQDDGSYAPLQCWGSVGECWCVNARGERTGAPLESCR